jgi:hypothetical protein
MSYLDHDITANLHTVIMNTDIAGKRFTKKNIPEKKIEYPFDMKDIMSKRIKSVPGGRHSP